MHMGDCREVHLNGATCVASNNIVYSLASMNIVGDPAQEFINFLCLTKYVALVAAACLTVKNCCD